MKIEALHIGMQVRHPQYGVGTIQNLSLHVADIQFEGGRRSVDPSTCDLQAAEPQAAVSGLEMPLKVLLDQMISATLDAAGYEQPTSHVEELAARWRHGRIVLHPSDPTLQNKELPVETLFHKIVMIRNNLRVLEQKINANPQLSDADKVELQQYITRCYGSLTTLNVLFKRKEDQFRGASTDT